MTKEREALKALIHEMEYVLSCINAEEIPFDGDDFHEALRFGKEALDHLAQPEQEPWECVCGANLYIDANGVPRSKASVEPATVMFKPEQEPVAWLITDEKINSLQVNSIQRLIDRARHAHMIDIKLRINGQDEWFQADWLKHLSRTTPPQRTWVGLDDIDLAGCSNQDEVSSARYWERVLMEKNK